MELPLARTGPDLSRTTRTGNIARPRVGGKAVRIQAQGLPSARHDRQASKTPLTCSASLLRRSVHECGRSRATWACGCSSAGFAS